MNFSKSRSPIIFSFIRLFCWAMFMGLLSACSTKKNTAGSRFWQSFTTRYNTYFNGNEAYKEGVDEQLRSNTDNFTSLIPVFVVGNPKTQDFGKAKFERAITKSEKAIQLHSIKRKPILPANKTRTEKMRQFLKREEFNPFLKNAWLLMGRAQFQKGDFIEAASTFSYITRHYATEPKVVAEAQAWMARAYAQMDWLFDAESALSNLRRDSLANVNNDEFILSSADLLIRQERFQEALPYLRKATKVAPSKRERTRLHFLLAQVTQQLGNQDEAYRQLNKVLAMSSSQSLTLNARILQTEVISTQGQGKKMIRRLTTMANNPNNKDFLDQIYYALGNILLATGDTTAALSAYEQGRIKGQRTGIEKGVLLVRLGNLYWDKRRFDKAQSCYSEALPLLGKEHKDYTLTMQRSAVLDRLVPYTTAVYNNDSLLALVALPEAQRLAIIDRIIATERHRLRDSVAEKRNEEARKRASENGLDIDDENTPSVVSPPTQTRQEAAMWYFYNSASLLKGKQTFVREWGRRKNEDNWRRRNKTLLSSIDESTSVVENNSINNNNTLETVEAETENKVRPNNPLSRDYYLAQLPFSDEAKALAHESIQEGLFNAGLIEKDELNDFPLAVETLLRLEREYPTFAQREELLYQLFLLYTQWGRNAEAERYRQLMASDFPDSKLTHTITHPNFNYNLTHGVQSEDSLYTATYEAFRQQNLQAVERGVRRSTEEFPNGANRAKFLLIDALSQLGRGNDKAVVEKLRSLVEQYPQNDITEVAANIAKGIESGRSVKGSFDTRGLWEQRTEVAKASQLPATEAQHFSAERNVPFLLVATFDNDTINDNLLLYDWANFNFTRFTARSFDIAKQRIPHQLIFTLGGFRNYDEVHLYTQRLFADRILVSRIRQARIALISERNYTLIGNSFTLSDYQKFYERIFVPLKINPELPLDEPELPEQKYEDVTPQPELPPTSTTRSTDSTTTSQAKGEPTTPTKTDPKTSTTPETKKTEPQKTEPVDEDDEDGEWYPV